MTTDATTRWGARRIGRAFRNCAVVLLAFIGAVTSFQRLTAHYRTPLADAVVAHVGIIVHDVDKTAKVFEEMFSVTVPPARTSPPISWAGNPAGPVQWRVKLTSFALGNMTIELVEPLDGPGPHRAFLEKHGQGMQHLAFTVVDRDAAFGFLRSKGGRQISATYVDMHESLGFTVEPMARAAQ